MTSTASAWRSKCRSERIRSRHCAHDDAWRRLPFTQARVRDLEAKLAAAREETAREQKRRGEDVEAARSAEEGARKVSRLAMEKVKQLQGELGEARAEAAQAAAALAGVRAEVAALRAEVGVHKMGAEEAMARAARVEEALQGRITELEAQVRTCRGGVTRDPVRECLVDLSTGSSETRVVNGRPRAPVPPPAQKKWFKISHG